jgi:hypothetical protein
VSIPYMAVKKGADIRVVWSCTENGVNPSIYVPRMYLPTGDSMIRRLPPGSWMGDIDSGEMFNNYMLHSSEARLNVVEISEKVATKWGLGCRTLVWDRNLFAWRPAPLFSIRMFLRNIEIMRRSRYDEMSAFAWATLELNLPTSKNYDPQMLRVIKRRKDGLLACDEVTFVDDGRPVGPTKQHVEKAVRQFGSGIQHLGAQEAARKRRCVGQRNGACAGNVVYTDHGMDRKFVSQVKWDKGKDMIRWIRHHLSTKQSFPFKPLLSKTGFLLHLALTYSWLRPFMKGLYLTVNSWRDGRDEEGWALPKVIQDKTDEQQEFEDWIADTVEKIECVDESRSDTPWNDLAESCPAHEPESGVVNPVPRRIVPYGQFLERR